jgi:phosphoribosyl-AMP cyclohydrolase
VTATPKPAADANEQFRPRFAADGTLTAIAVDAASGEILMLAHMNEASLAATRATGVAHYWSRSRGRLWRKGEESGNEQRVVEILVDCDQDALLLRVEVAGAGASCHTGRRSCFYRRLPLAGEQLELLPSEPLFDPAAVYREPD